MNKCQDASRRRLLRALGLGGLSIAGEWNREVGNLWKWVNPAPVAADDSPIFRIVTPEESHITWVHDNAASEAHYLPESMASGCAFFDYDNDGWMDIFLVNTGPCDFFQPSSDHRPRNALYKNNRDGTFTDVTAHAGLEGVAFGMGVAAGDYDGDGFTDLYVTAYGRNTLYHNNGDGTFTDVTEKAGLMNPNWSTSAVWFDYDNDGKLDLFVCSFVQYDGNSKNLCGNNLAGKHYYCIPRLFQGRASKLYHNNGDGTFTEVGHLTSIGKKLGKSHGVVATDINNDGWMDLFVTNDTEANFLFANRGGGKFEEIGFQAGVAYSDAGRPRSGMGVDSADYDNDGKLDLFVANIDHEQFSIYHNDGAESFSDAAAESGIARATHLYSGWGLKFFDYDNDGDLDLILSNGHPDDMVQIDTPGVTYREPLLLFHGGGSGNFENVSGRAGPAFQKMWSARGLAVGDFDNDGALDVLINNNGGAPLLLHNEVGRKNHWLGLQLIGRKCNIGAVGAWIRWGFNGKKRARLKTAGGSFLSSHDPREILGIGTATKLDFLEVQWPQPSGKVERFTNVPIDRYVVIEEGKGLRS
ncbi:MAG: CRTAC1 family protein [Terracidiphilus sp.]